MIAKSKMNICGFSVSQEVASKLDRLFRVPHSPRLEAESTKLALMGRNSLCISIIRQSFLTKKLPLSEEVSDTVTHNSSTSHIVSYIASKVGPLEISASKLATVFYCYCQLVVETEWTAVFDFSKLDDLVSELIKFIPPSSTSPPTSAAFVPRPTEALILSVADYNERMTRGALNYEQLHPMVRLLYMTGAGNQRELVCCPHCCTTSGCVGDSDKMRNHTGHVELTRDTKSAAARTKVIARWSCCGAPIATTDTSVAGYKFEPRCKCENSVA